MPVRVQRHEWELGSWELVTRGPDPRFGGAVRRIVGYEERSSQPVRRREAPQECVSLFLNLGPPLGVGGPAFPMAGRGSFVAAINDSYAVTDFTGLSRGMQVDLSPLAAHMVLGVPMRELAPLVVELEDVLGREGSALLERLQDAPGWDARFDLLDEFIGRRLEDGRRPSPDAAWAWRRLRQTDGRLPIGELARELGCSRRHLISRFREHVGPAPKTAARILRFRRALRLLDHHGGARLAEIAQDCGYYDQAHLNRDFRELAGTTPTRYLTSPSGLGVAA